MDNMSHGSYLEEVGMLFVRSTAESKFNCTVPMPKTKNIENELKLTGKAYYTGTPTGNNDPTLKL